jgi:hypothetical protein
VPHWSYDTNSIDAALAFDILLTNELLQAVLRVLRPGGRFIIVNPMQDVEETFVIRLENAGYHRILVEPALMPPTGVLIRGEKPHVTANTQERIRQVAEQDGNALNLKDYRGRYIYLLVQQTPNKPVWKLEPDEKIEWQAVAVKPKEAAQLLAFTSLPKAVSFMQPAVLQGFVRDINKVGKFSKETARNWTLPVLLNPTLEQVQDYTVIHFPVDPTSAEAPDE